MSAFKSDRISPTFWYYENHAYRIQVWGNFWHLGKNFFLLLGEEVQKYGKTHYHVRLLDQTCSPHWTSTAWLSGFWRVWPPWARFGYKLAQIYQFEDLVKINGKISTVVLQRSAVFKYKICQNYVKNCCRPQIHYFDITKVQLRQLVD